MTNALTLLRQWSDLPALTLDDLVGTWRAEFVAPLRHVAPAGLGLIGLPRWYGKRFEAGGDGLVGVNLLRAPDGGFEEHLPMRATIGISTKDGNPAGVITYAPDASRPWRWIRDDVRVRADGILVGMSVVDRPILRGLGLPFLLRRDG